MAIEKCNSNPAQMLYNDLEYQLNNAMQKCPLPASPLTDAVETRKASNIMHKIIGRVEDEDAIVAKWLHSAWTRCLC